MSKTTRSPYASRAWRKLSKAVQERDGYECKVKRPGCTGRSQCADHIVPLEHGGRLLDPRNVRASCNHCNAIRSNETRKKPAASVPPSREW